jgi:hypothetical protein
MIYLRRRVPSFSIIWTMIRNANQSVLAYIHIQINLHIYKKNIYIYIYICFYISWNLASSFTEDISQSRRPAPFILFMAIGRAVFDDGIAMPTIMNDSFFFKSTPGLHTRALQTWIKLLLRENRLGNAGCPGALAIIQMWICSQPFFFLKRRGYPSIWVGRER